MAETSTHKNTKIVFYSWQSDLPNQSNRGFIQQALENSAKAIQADDSVTVEPVIDRDTQNVPGSPDIAATIFAKIVVADVFIADVSIINHPRKGRPTPNPNVLIELGYALKALGQERVILVFNKSSGKIQDLPFDLRTRRLTTYQMSPDTESRADERKKLERQLNKAIRTAIEQAPLVSEDSLLTSTIDAIENQKPNRKIILRRFLSELFKKLEDLEPLKHRDGGTVDDLIKAIKQTQEPVAEFSKIAETISLMNDLESATEMHKWFGKIFEQYNLPQNYTGGSSTADGDYFKFLGHELFVTSIAFLIREQCWDTLGRIITEPIPMHYIPYQSGSGSVNWQYASEHIALLLDESKKRKRASLHADILKDRHTTGGLSALLPFDDFIAADFFLFLMKDLPPDQPQGFMEWRAWSTLYLKHIPLFIRNAEYVSNAEQLIKIINVASVSELKKRLIERMPRLGKLFDNTFWSPQIQTEDLERIGTLD